MSEKRIIILAPTYAAAERIAIDFGFRIKTNSFTINDPDHLRGLARGTIILRAENWMAAWNAQQVHQICEMLSHFRYQIWDHVYDGERAGYLRDEQARK